MQLRDYQKEIARKGADLLRTLGMVYLAMEVRTGKTLTAFAICYLMKFKKVLFVTRKMAMQSVNHDFATIPGYFNLTVINYDSLHKVAGKFDCVIVDEAHSLGAHPKPAKRTKALRGLVNDSYVILMSGTPNPETFSQLYHQFWISEKYSPFRDYRNFYKWAQVYVDVRERIYNGVKVREYSRAHTSMIQQIVEKYFIRWSQEDAGFNQFVQEEIIKVPIGRQSPIVEKFNKDHIYQFTDGSTILGDTAAKRMQKIHQLYSGTVKSEDGKGLVIDYTKALYIRENYQGKKIAIYYCFIAEGDLLRKAFPEHTNDPAHFNSTGPDTVFISQIQSGSMGVNLSAADYIIFYNIHFSSLLYWQARARMQSKDRTKDSIVHWIFTEGGIEEKIYKVVQQKKDYTTYYFRKDFDHGTTKNNRANIPVKSDKAFTRPGGVCR